MAIRMELLRLYLPVLFPSWRFFAEVGASPRLIFFEDGFWHDGLIWPDRLGMSAHLFRLIWNADRNEALYLAALSERLVAEPAPWIGPEIARRLMLRFDLPDPPRFRIAFVTPDGMEAVYESPGHGA